MQNTNDNNKSSSIEDILKSVRGIIDNHNTTLSSQDDAEDDNDVLELTSVVEDEINPEVNQTFNESSNNRILKEPASGSKMLGDLGAKGQSVFNIHEDPSTKSTKQIAAEVGFSHLISDRVRQQTAAEISKFTKIIQENNIKEEKSLEITMEKLVKPLIKDWINNNLPQMVEKILKEEISKIIPK